MLTISWLCYFMLDNKYSWCYTKESIYNNIIKLVLKYETNRFEQIGYFKKPKEYVELQ